MDDRDRDLLQAIAGHARIALGYATEMGTGWDRDIKTIDAVSKRLEQVGELAKRLTPDALAVLEEIDWRGVKGMREILAHDDEDVDVAIVREAISVKLPRLVEGIERVLFVEGA